MGRPRPVRMRGSSRIRLFAHTNGSPRSRNRRIRTPLIPSWNACYVRFPSNGTVRVYARSQADRCKGYIDRAQGRSSYERRSCDEVSRILYSHSRWQFYMLASRVAALRACQAIDMLSARLRVNEAQVLHRDLGAPCVDEKRPIAALHQGISPVASWPPAITSSLMPAIMR
jgi:hypothetical protein